MSYPSLSFELQLMLMSQNMNIHVLGLLTTNGGVGGETSDGLAGLSCICRVPPRLMGEIL